MEPSFEEQLLTIAQGTIMPEERKKAIKHELALFMESAANVRASTPYRHNTEQRSLFANFFRPMPIFATLLMVALIGGGTSYAAERALPGDPLYPVKVHVNEEVKAALSFSSESKADWDASRAERRLEEAADLAANGKLNAETQLILEDNFQHHADRVETRIAEMQKSENQRAAATVASRFETSLKVHDQILDRIGEARINIR
ncbi:MAG: DUF5667 domain-containing protein, partial [Candidatus Omnitrophota bacterium]|nr:DUF5667 domain-containing protein [Candidatus Omnitrophota bacterium]